MALAFVQSVSVSDQVNGGSNPTTSGITTTSGNLLIMIATVTSDDGTFAISDNKGNTWTLAKNFDATSVEIRRIYYAYNCIGGAGHTFHIVTGGVGTIVVNEWSGALTTNPLDQTVATATATSLATGVGPTATLAQADELIIACVYRRNSTITVGSGYSNFLVNESSPANIQGYTAIQSQVVNSTSGVSTTFGGGGNGDMAIATFKAAPPPTTSTSSSISSTSSSTSISTSSSTSTSSTSSSISTSSTSTSTSSTSSSTSISTSSTSSSTSTSISTSSTSSSTSTSISTSSTSSSTSTSTSISTSSTSSSTSTSFSTSSTSSSTSTSTSFSTSSTSSSTSTSASTSFSTSSTSTSTTTTIMEVGEYPSATIYHQRAFGWINPQR